MEEEEKRYGTAELSDPLFYYSCRSFLYIFFMDLQIDEQRSSKYPTSKFCSNPPRNPRMILNRGLDLRGAQPYSLANFTMA